MGGVVSRFPLVGVPPTPSARVAFVLVRAFLRPAVSAGLGWRAGRCVCAVLFPFGAVDLRFCVGCGSVFGYPRQRCDLRKWGPVGLYISRNAYMTRATAGGPCASIESHQTAGATPPGGDDVCELDSGLRVIPIAPASSALAR